MTHKIDAIKGRSQIPTPGSKFNSISACMADLQQCLSLYERASTDNERMAALLLVAKVVNSGELSGEQRRMVFDSVGFSFVNRLLVTGIIPEGCTVNPYHQIAVTLLACFCTDEDLVVHPEVIAKIPQFNDFISLESPSGEVSSMVEDSLQCLQAMASQPVGLGKVLTNGTLEALAKCFTHQHRVSSVAKKLLLQIVGQSGMVNHHPKAVVDALDAMGAVFQKNQDALKFELCDALRDMISLAREGISKQLCEQPKVLCYLGHGLKDILSSRINSSQRNSALQLTAVLCHTCGMDWVMLVQSSGEGCGSFFKLLVRLVCVEVHLALDSLNLSDVVSNSALVSACFAIMEQTIVYLSKLPDRKEEAKPLSSEDLLQLHVALTEALAFVVRFLIGLSGGFPPSSLRCVPVVQASVRVLGAWLAEDSLALSDEICKLLPFLLELCTADRQAVQSDTRRGKEVTGNTEEVRRGTECALACPVPEASVDTGTHDPDQPLLSNCAVSASLSDSVGEEVDLLKFLLPGLAGLTAEEKPRKILLEADLSALLLHYLKTLLTLYPQSRETEVGGCLTLCLGVLLNVCVTEPQAVLHDKRFTSALPSLIGLMSEGCDDALVLRLHSLLLFLMVTRRQGIYHHPYPSRVWEEVLKLLLIAVQYFPPLHTATASPICWEEVSELWLLAMQELAAIFHDSTEDRCSATAVESDSLLQFDKILKILVRHHEDCAEENEEGKNMQTVISVLCSLFQALDFDYIT